MEKILFGTEQMVRTDNNITLVNVKNYLNACKSLSKKELDNLSDTARDFFLLYSIFWEQSQTQRFCKYMAGRR